jgi:2-C-methyl-D-erythritol 4-phosphate cytidylyltransferase
MEQTGETSMPRFAVILPAAGQSSRFRGGQKKPFTPLNGRAVWLWSAGLFVSRAEVCQCVIVVAREDQAAFREQFSTELARWNIGVADGGSERFESVANALSLLTAEADFVAVHDAARPCTPPALIEAVFARAAQTGAALLAVPVADTIKRGDGQGRIQATVPRQGLWLAQTPQVFRRDWLVAAYAARHRLGRDVTDDAQLVEAAGHPVHLVASTAANLKITTQEDFALAEAILRAGNSELRTP